MLRDRLLTVFRDCYGEFPQYLVRAPGRVNIIGEHTDYNEGFVLPMAIDRAIWVAFRRREDHDVRLYSIDFEQAIDFNLNHLKYEKPSWVEYIKGVAWVLAEAGYPLKGWDGVLIGDVPIGAGLSSSAALEIAATRVFAELGRWEWKATTMARLAQRAENVWMKVDCGIMDQLISAVGKAGHAVLIDCRNLDVTAVPLPVGTIVIVMDTRTRRQLVDSAYNQRRQQCQAVANFFGVPALRDISLEALTSARTQLDALAFRRARHVISENERTLQASEAMRKGDARMLGQLMRASHLSLKRDFAVSSRELDIMVKIANQQKGCYGARMTGGGFGGCAVALVDKTTVDDFVPRVHQAYQEVTSITPSLYICQASAGAEVIPQ